MEHLAPLESWFLDVEDGADHMHIASLALFEGPPPDDERLLETVRIRLALVPRCRQRLQEVAFGLARPIWVDDPHFDVRYHVRRTAVAAPGGDAELQTLMGRLMSQELDRTRPLWELWLIEGVSGGRWGLVTKAHHCMVDGVAGVDIMAALMDLTPDAPVGEDDGWTPTPPPSRTRLYVDAAGELTSAPARIARRVGGVLRHPRRTWREASPLVRGVTDLAGILRPTAPNCLNGPVGPHRVWAVARASLADAKEIGHATGTTVNDVVLAAITRGYRELLLSRGDVVPADRVVRTMVPVNLRTESPSGRLDNQVATMAAHLPVGMTDPVAALEALHAEVAAHKARHEAEGGGALLELLAELPPPLVEVGTRGMVAFIHRFGQRFLNTVTTNVPGPQLTLYAFGRRLLEVFPYVPVAEGITVGVAIFSYDGQLTFGVTGDFDASPDVGVLAAGIEAGVTDLRGALIGRTSHVLQRA